MSYWLALIPSPSPKAHEHATVQCDTQQYAIGCWALQFTPHVVLLEDAVLLEAQGSLRLFGGPLALTQRIQDGAKALGCDGFAFAPTALAALALARAQRQDSFSGPLRQVLDSLPLGTLSAAAAQRDLLARIGCKTLGDIRALPRGGMNRRFGPALLAALDEAYGERPGVYDWLMLPETFTARLELPSRVETAPALLFGAQRLLLQMTGWLTARHAGIRDFTLGWIYDVRRDGHAPASDRLILRTAEPTCRSEHLVRLLSEHLARTRLAAPVTGLVLSADDIEVLAPRNASLLPDERGEHEPLHQLLERLAARLGPQRVRRPVLVSDHRFEAMQRWQPADALQPATGAAPGGGLPQPSWLLREPLHLTVRDDKPLYQGALQLLAGPHRVEAGWWDRRPVTRDYFVAQSEQAGLLWIYRERIVRDDTHSNWFLHGLFG